MVSAKHISPLSNGEGQSRAKHGWGRGFVLLIHPQYLVNIRPVV